ncbi:uncharacterized protein FIBRA_09571 [Fibroporia radiculosa]|uniref:Reverse transcriptase domain-containing protein n=1 Tax=Fibroporia radiculosa TaxID=599839 RepID=J7SCJ0_9APHY|nr:uncharacterized protein FIBRA_09571 [Fibroporia radiculosa]CCM07226.1 predicted protein [Fibroporia radiculosa]
MAEDKVSAVLNWPKIDSVKALQRFLGFANFYCRFIPGYSKVTQPLFDLLRHQSTLEIFQDSTTFGTT